MHYFSDLGQRADGPCAHARHQQKLREILRSAFGGGGKIAVQPRTTMSSDLIS